MELNNFFFSIFQNDEQNILTFIFRWYNYVMSTKFSLHNLPNDSVIWSLTLSRVQDYYNWYPSITILIAITIYITRLLHKCLNPILDIKSEKNICNIRSVQVWKM